MSITYSDDLAKLNGKRVTVTLNQNHDALEAGSWVGRLERATPAFILFKVKGSAIFEMIPFDKVDSVVLVEEPKAEKEKVDKAKLKIVSTRKDPVTLENVRRHLATFHGVQLTWLNADDTTPEMARDWHDQVDHSDLGHHHAVLVKETEASAEVA